MTLLDKLNSQPELHWYFGVAVKYNQSRAILVHPIETRAHERFGKAVTTFTSQHWDQFEEGVQGKAR